MILAMPSSLVYRCHPHKELDYKKTNERIPRKYKIKQGKKVGLLDVLYKEF